MFEVPTPLGFTVRTSELYWQKLIAKHPDIAGLCDLVQETRRDPDEIRYSSRDRTVGMLVHRHELVVEYR